MSQVQVAPNVKQPEAGSRLALAHAALRRGEAVLLYDADGREEETDLVIASQFATMEAVRTLRTEAGGLLCTAIAPEHHAKLGLPFLSDLVRSAAEDHPVLRHMHADDIRYDPSRSSFGLTVNHRSTYTGIPDGDRSTTILALASFLSSLESVPAAEAQTHFGRDFRAPGHCILLNGAPGGLAARQGHTELSLELARQAGLVPSTTICEMLDPTSGKALGKKQAMAYAQRKGLVFLEGRDVIQAWQARNHGQATAAVPA